MLYSRFIPLVTLLGAVALGDSGEGGDDGEKEDGKIKETVASTRPTTTVEVRELCLPTDKAGHPLPDAPCNQLENLWSICRYFSAPSNPVQTPRPRSVSDRHKCFCDPNGDGAYLFEALSGCSECARKHGERMGDGWIPVEWISAVSSSYCAMPSPTVLLESFMDTWANKIDFDTMTSRLNELGTSTDVSLYFTSTLRKGAAATATTTSVAVTGLIDITSSTKKRKLSKPDTSAEPSPPYESRSQSGSGSRQIKSSSPSPPRPIPQHLLPQESLARRSPTPDLSSTTASSPSAAYSSLTLEGEPRSGGGSGSDTTGVPDITRLAASRGILSGITGQPRSASPAKRTRSEMNTEEGEDAGTTKGSSPLASESRSDAPDMEPENKHTKLTEDRHKREVSVDMLASERDGYGEENAMDSIGEDGGGASADGAYLTPQSGISILTSKAAHAKSSGIVLSTAKESRPSIDDQIAQVSKLAQHPLQEGQKGYIISKEWLTRVMARGTQTYMNGKVSKDLMEGEIGPVDNTGLSMVTDRTSIGFKDEAGETFVPLKPGLLITDDFEVVPQEAWDLIVKWYGLAQGSPVLTRYCHNTTTSETMENLQFELSPPVFTVLKLPDRVNGLSQQALRERDTVPVKILASRHEGFQKFLKRAKAAVGVENKTKVRVWRILSSLGETPQAGMLTPAHSRSASPVPNVAAPIDPGTKLVLDLPVFLSLPEGAGRELIEAKDESMNDNYNGHRTLSLVGLSQDDVIVLEEQIGGPAGGEWASSVVNSDLSRNGVPVSITRNGSTSVMNNLKPKANTGNGRTSPVSTGGIMTRGRAQKNGRAKGTVGLGNLGNTCYMNSALQCVRSVEELTMYFLEDKYKKELNPRNPLSHNGEVAKAYAALLRELYGESTNSSFSPRSFKQIIGKYGPSFSGYGQQDSQEFLLFLLDGLQEDLNRIHQKPYIEKPDSTDEMVSNPVALRGLAEKCWDIYKARNDSVITDLFAGMYKSTVVCPVCDKVSIIFDPFNNLTLQLPIENMWYRNVYVFPLLSKPVRVSVEVDKHSSFFAIKEFVGSRLNIDPKKMIIAEIYKHKFFKTFEDKTCIGDERIADGDVVAIFELDAVPSNYPPPKKKNIRFRSMLSYNNSDEEEELPEGDSPLADSMLVAVFNRVIKGTLSKYQQKQKELFGVPTYIILTREEARDQDAILRKVLSRVATMTSTDILRVNDERSETESNLQDSETVLMTTEDADSSSDSKIQASSVQSEDGLVNISVNDAAEETQPTAHISYPPRLPISEGTSRFMQPEEFIDPGLRAMFEMKYFSGEQMIPTGWTCLQDENKNFPAIASRISQRRTTRAKRSAGQQLAHRIKHNGSGSSSDEDADDPLPPVTMTRSSYSNDDNSDGSDGLPPVAALIDPNSRGSSRSYGKKQQGKAGLITYSHKGKQRNAAWRKAASSTEGETDSGTEDAPLLRLGEAIILDWTPEAHESLFCEPRDDTGMRGHPTWIEIETMPDPELDRVRQVRSSRRRNGVSLDDCLDEFGKVEILSENDAWFCPRCKEHRRASKKFELWKAPDILVIHLKRFSNQGRLRDKLDVVVDFPVEGLDLTSRLAVQEQGKSPLYDLFAVDNHYGGMGGGHYTAYAQNSYDKNWYEYNDSMTTRKQNPQQVVTSAAYLLFYRRRSPIPLGGPTFEKLFNKASNPSQDSTSQSASRTESPSAPAGEDKRLGDFSRIGSSSASRGAGAVRQAGNGGLGGLGTMTTVTTRDQEDELPDYSENLPDGERTLESMEVDESAGHRLLDAQEPEWQGFGPLSDIDPMDDAALENSSMKANSSNGATDDDDAKSLGDFDPHDDFGYGIQEMRPMDDDEVPMLMEDGKLAQLDGTEEVVELRLEDEDGVSSKLE